MLIAAAAVWAFADPEGQWFVVCMSALVILAGAQSRVWLTLAGAGSLLLAIVTALPRGVSAASLALPECLVIMAALAVSSGFLLRQTGERLHLANELAAGHQALLESRHMAERFRARLHFVLRAVDGYWERDADGDALYWSDGIYRLFGLEPGSIRPDGSIIRSHLHPDDVSRFDETFRRHHQEGREYRAELRVRQPDGSYRWILSIGMAEIGEDGTPRKLYGAAINIDPLKRAETERLEARIEADAARQRLSLAIESLDDGFVLFDEHDRLALCNRRFREIYPHTSPLFREGMPFEEIIRFAVANGRIEDAHGREEKWIAERLEQHRNPRGPHLQHLADGRWIQVNERRMPEGGIVGIRTDVTALKEAQRELEESEGRLRALLEAFTDGHFDRNFRTEEEYWSPGAYRLIGVDPEAAPHPTHEFFQRHVHPDDSAAVANAVRAHIDGQAPYCVQFRLRQPDGGWRWVESRGRLIRDRDGRPLRLIGGTNDIHAMREAEELKLKHQMEAERSHRHLTDAIESMQDGFALYDSDGWLVMCNRRFREILAAGGASFEPGTAYSDQLATAVANGFFAEAVGREKAWTAQWLERRKKCAFTGTQRLGDGRWLQFSDRRTSDGGTVALRSDITQLKLTEERLAESERRFRDYADSTSDWFWETDSDHRFTYISGRMTEITGLSAGSVIGRRREELAFGPGDWQALERIGKAMDRREAFRDIRLIRRVEDERQIHIRLSGKPIFDMDGVFLGYRGAGTDITPIVEMDIQRERAEQILVRTVEALPLLFGLFDREDRLVVCNRRFREVFEVENDPQGPLPAFETLVERFAVKSLLGTAEEAAAWLRNRRNHRETPQVRFDFRYDGGRWMSVSDFPMADGGNLWLSVDITDVRRAQAMSRLSERRLRTIIDAAPDAIVTLDANGNIQAFSRFAEALFGLAESDVAGSDVRCLMAGDNDRQPLPPWWEGPPKPLDDHEVCARRADGSIFPAIISLVAAPSDDQPGYTLFLRDISELRKRDEALRQAQKMEAVGQLTGGVAHDFNNLLTAILGNIEMLEPAVRDRPDCHEMVRELKSAATLGADLVTRLLAFSRRTSLESRTLDLRSVILELVPLLGRTLGPAICLQNDLADDMPCARADPVQLRNAIINLAINARDAMPRGGVLEITGRGSELGTREAASRSVRPGRFAVIDICDSGEGIAPEDQERVFEPFYTTKENGRGTGLGLSAVYGFARQSGGFVSLESVPGSGTRFSLWLPEHEVADDPVHDDTADTGDPGMVETVDLPRGDGHTVLVVEDDSLVRRVTVSSLERLDYIVLEAATADEALDLLDLVPKGGTVLSDVIMPGGVSGLDLIGEIERLRPDIRLLLTSGYIDRQNEGNVRYPLLRKPFTVERLARFMGPQPAPARRTSAVKI